MRNFQSRLRRKIPIITDIIIKIIGTNDIGGFPPHAKLVPPPPDIDPAIWAEDALIASINSPKEYAITVVNKDKPINNNPATRLFNFYHPLPSRYLNISLLNNPASLLQ